MRSTGSNGNAEDFTEQSNSPENSIARRSRMGGEHNWRFAVEYQINSPLQYGLSLHTTTELIKPNLFASYLPKTTALKKQYCGRHFCLATSYPPFLDKESQGEYAEEYGLMDGGGVADVRKSLLAPSTPDSTSMM